MGARCQEPVHPATFPVSIWAGIMPTLVLVQTQLTNTCGLIHVVFQSPPGQGIEYTADENGILSVLGQNGSVPT